MKLLTRYPWMLALLATISSVFCINRYRFPGMAQSLSIPMVKHLIDPTLYANDMYISQADKLYSFFWPTVGWLLQTDFVSLELLFFLLYTCFTFFTFLGLIQIVRACGGGMFASTVAVFILIFNRTFLGNDYFLDQDLDTIGPARVALLYSWYYLLQGRSVASTILQAIVFLVHPLSGIYGALIHFCFCLGRGARVFGLHVGIWLLLVSPMVFWMFSREVGLSETIDPVWFDLVRLRAPDHVALSNWSFWDSFYTGLTLSLTMALGNKISSVRHFIRWAVVGISLAMLIGYLGSELLPSSAVIRAQFFRATTLLGPLSALVYALFLEKQLQESSRLKIIGSFVIGLTLFGYSPYLHAWFYGLAAFASFGLLVVFVSQSQRLHFSPASLLVTFLIALSAGAFWLRGDFSYRSTADADWRAVQKWAAETTDQAAVFIVPPASTGFRIESERASFGSWFDGTILFFDSATGREWMHRMKLLGWRRENGLPYFFDEYLSESTQIQKLLEDQSLQSLQNVYLVFDRDSREGFFGEALIRFGRYRVYQLKGSL